MGRWFRDEWRWELQWRRGWFQWEHDLVQQLREDINMVVQAKEVVMVGVGLGVFVFLTYDFDLLILI